MHPIRVGMIRCDTHGMYYGPLMAKHDPLLFSLPVPMDQPQPPHSWMRGGCHFYFYTNYGNPTLMTVDMVEGFEITKVWDERSEVAELTRRVLLDRPVVCRTLEEASDDVDLVFIADCNGDGSDHLQLAKPGLERGVPTFVDKPFACEVRDVLEILRLADAHQAPVMSLSILRALPAATQFARRLPETGGVQFGTIQGGGTKMAGLVHTVSLAQHVFGPGVQTVRAVSGPAHTSFHLDYGQRSDRPKHGVMINCDVGRSFHGAMYVSAFGPRRAIHSSGLGDWDFPAGAADILRLAKKMVQTRQPQAPRDEMIECIAVTEAARLAQQTGQPVGVEEVLRRARSGAAD